MRRVIYPMPGLGRALPAVVFAVIAIACGSDSVARTAEPDAARNTPPVHTFLKPCVEDGYCGVFQVGGQLLTAAWLDDERMYLSDMEGSIRLLNVETGESRTVLEGLTHPQGMTVLDGRLYVSDLGNYRQLTMELGRCLEECQASAESRAKYLQEYLSRISARVLSYRIDEFGGLAGERVVVDGLPARGVHHSPNGLINDGEYVYVSIGSVMRDAREQEGIVDESEYPHPRIDLSGVIARFRHPDGEIEVYASGFRNLYGISIGPDGMIYGADNDDDAGHLEELNAIVEGGFYGFPYWGTNEAPPEENVIEPVAVIAGTSSTYAHANDDGVYVAYWRSGHDHAQESGYMCAVDLFDYETWMPNPVFRSRGLITSILEGKGMLYLATLSGNVHVIDPSVATLPIYGAPGGAFRNNDYAFDVISSVSPIVQSGYDVYLDGERLLYAKSSCSEADRTTGFFLHVVPVDPNDLDEGREDHGFDNLDFTFISHQGWRSGSSCFVVVELPGYEIREIRTGQVVRRTIGYTRLWDAEFRFEE